MDDVNEKEYEVRGQFSRLRARPVVLAVVLLTFALLIAACAGQGGTATPAGRSAAATSAPPAGAAEATAAQPLAATPSSEGAPAPAEATIEPTEPAAQPAEATATPAATSAEAPPAPATEPPAAAPLRLDAVKIALEPYADGFSNPLFVTHAGDDSNRVFVVEKTGAIRIVANGQTLPQPFLDISDRINSGGSEQGLLGLAFPPDFATRRFFFVNYTDRQGDTVIARYNVTEDPNVADAGSEFVTLKLDQPAANHNGGDLAFGPDGFLWVGMGDGGAANDRFENGQNPDTLLGKMLRLDVTSDLSRPHIIPEDNPWVNGEWNGRRVAPEIWAVGLRNPWRYSFDRATGDLWIADVGQNQIEEVNVTRAPLTGGLNFGWPIQEGNACFRDRNCDLTGLVQPVAQYNHGQDGCSVTGGYVYRGQRFPSLVGAYLYGDYCSGRIWALDAANPGAPVLLASVGAGLSSFGEDQAGEIYITDLTKGTVRRVVGQ